MDRNNARNAINMRNLTNVLCYWMRNAYHKMCFWQKFLLHTECNSITFIYAEWKWMFSVKRLTCNERKHVNWIGRKQNQSEQIKRTKIEMYLNHFQLLYYCIMYNDNESHLTHWKIYRAVNRLISRYPISKTLINCAYRSIFI